MQLATFVKIMAICASSISPLLAQSPDPLIDVSTPLFEPSVLHEINLTMTDSDWQTLRENYTLNTIYRGTFD